MKAKERNKNFNDELEFWTNLYWSKKPIKRTNQIENLIWTRMCELHDILKK